MISQYTSKTSKSQVTTKNSKSQIKTDQFLSKLLKKINVKITVDL